MAYVIQIITQSFPLKFVFEIHDSKSFIYLRTTGIMFETKLHLCTAYCSEFMLRKYENFAHSCKLSTFLFHCKFLRNLSVIVVVL